MWYVMRVTEGQEQRCCALCSALAGSAGSSVFFVPRVVHKKSREGVWREEYNTLFPGYLFVDTDNAQGLAREIAASKEIVPLLQEGELLLPVLQEERETLEGMMDAGHTVLFSKGIVVDGTLYVDEGPLQNGTAYVTQVRRHQRKATLELSLSKREVRALVGLEVPHKLSGEEFLQSFPKEEFLKTYSSGALYENIRQKLTAKKQRAAG